MLETNLEKGIQGDAADLTKRSNAFGSNAYPRKKREECFLVNSLPIYIFSLIFFIRAITLSLVEEENISYYIVLFCFVLDVSLISVTQGAFVSLQDNTLCLLQCRIMCATSFFLSLCRATKFLVRHILLSFSV